MKRSMVSPRYARALIEAATEQDALERVRADVDGLLSAVRQSGDLRAFLSDPLIHPEDKAKAFRALFSGRVGDVTLSFLLLLCEKRRERLLEDILQGFSDQLDARQGIVTAQVRSAVALTPSQQEALAQRLSSYSGRKVRLEVEVEAGLKAGFVARLGDQVFDGSLEAQLALLRQRLASGP